MAFQSTPLKSSFLENVEGANNSPKVSESKSYGSDMPAAVNLIYFDKPAAPGKAPVQRGASLREGSYRLASEGEVGTLGLVPSDWNDGRESPTPSPKGGASAASPSPQPTSKPPA